MKKLFVFKSSFWKTLKTPDHQLWRWWGIENLVIIHLYLIFWFPSNLHSWLSKVFNVFQNFDLKTNNFCIDNFFHKVFTSPRKIKLLQQVIKLSFIQDYISEIQTKIKSASQKLSRFNWLKIDFSHFCILRNFFSLL